MKRTIILLLLFPVIPCLDSCVTSRKAGQLQEQQITATLALPEHYGTSFRELDLPRIEQDTLLVHDFEGREVIVMN
ncbi:MAG: hypothetical protein IJ636_03975, partial [Bacteroidales bacterium]|nr:hypothetical protein [Bacteroidales bacterium]